MSEEEPTVHPYIPNSVPAVREAMLRAIGARSTDDLFDAIPERLRFRGRLEVPGPLRSECELRRHVREILGRNRTCQEYSSFLGAGCYQHAVPAVCDEVAQRSEFLTAYAGEPYDDHGRFQSLFEYASLMGELLDLDVVNVPTYDGYQAAATAIRMAARITGRREVLLSRATNPDKLSKIRDYAKPDLKIELVDFDPQTGELDLDRLRRRVSARTAAVYFENPSYLGVIEPSGEEITRIAHAVGALVVVSVDPISLGVLVPPNHYGADITCGDIQPLGLRMQFGGGQGGFIATRDEERFVREYPSRLFGIVPTSVDGEYGFGDVAYERTSFAEREEGKEFVGTAAALCGITAGVYLSLMGPQGMREIGEGILARAHYAIAKLAEIPGISAPLFRAAHFQEFVVRFPKGTSVRETNQRLLQRGIFGGKDLTREFPELGPSGLYCVSEVHTQAEIERLADLLREAVS